MPLAEILKARDADKGRFGSPEGLDRSQSNPSLRKDADRGPVTSLEVAPRNAAPRVKTGEIKSAAAQPSGKKAPSPTPTEATSMDVLRRPLFEPTEGTPKQLVSSELKVARSLKNGVVVFFSCKGGSGATTIAINSAHAYVRQKLSTCVLDLDLQLGDAMAALALQPKQTIAQVVAGVQRGEGLRPNELTRHSSGIAVLSQVGSLDDLDRINPETLSQLLGELRQSFDVVCVDGVRDFSDNVLAVLDAADKIAIVTVQEILAIKRARWAFQILRKIGFEGADMTLVVNRCAMVSEIPLPTIRKMFEPAEVIPVPTDYAMVVDSLNRGIPLANIEPQHLVTRHIDSVAAILVGQEQMPLLPQSIAEQSLLSRLMFWRKT